MAYRLSIPDWLDSALATLLPRSCLLCGAAAQEALCPACLADLPGLGNPRCPVCAVPLAAPAPACGACLSSPPAFDATVAALRYAHPVDHLVQSLKFARRLASADFLAARLCALPAPQGDVVVPVPLSPLRLRARGFNQALEIARPLARHWGMPLWHDSLVRVRETLPQSALPWHARNHNLRHAFASRADFSGKSAIVIDDVMTSGATLDAVARVLKDHGATRVTNWVAARAIKRAT